MNECLRELILNGSYPVIFRETAEWELLMWGLEDWSNIFSDEMLPFRCAEKHCQKNPLWEGSCQIKYQTMDEFFQFCNNEEAVKKEWRYLDYKHMTELLKDKISFFKAVSWNKVGFPERGVEDSTLWIGSSGAHTPCHLDTYGCNIIAQVYGKKRWLLFPPSETNNLKPTRVPYEESSIYSNINFSCFENCKDECFENCYLIDLNPGDILFVPARWWHYVENLSTAISINSWIPHKNDDYWRLEEALIRYFISSIMGNIPKEITQVLLNPNEYDLEENITNLDILNFCKMKCKKKIVDSPVAEHVTDIFQNQSHCHKYKRVPKVLNLELKEILKDTASCKLNKDKVNDQTTVNCQRTSDLISVINAFCHPDVIYHVRNKLLE